MALTQYLIRTQNSPGSRPPPTVELRRYTIRGLTKQKRMLCLELRNSQAFESQFESWNLVGVPPIHEPQGSFSSIASSQIPRARWYIRARNLLGSSSRQASGVLNQ